MVLVLVTQACRTQPGSSLMTHPNWKNFHHGVGVFAKLLPELCPVEGILYQPFPRRRRWRVGVARESPSPHAALRTSGVAYHWSRWVEFVRQCSSC